MGLGRPARVWELAYRRSFVFLLSFGWLFAFGPVKGVLLMWMQLYFGAAQQHSGASTKSWGLASSYCFGRPWYFAGSKYFGGLEPAHSPTSKKAWADASTFWPLVVTAKSTLRAQYSIFATDLSWPRAAICWRWPFGCSVLGAPTWGPYYFRPLEDRWYSWRLVTVGYCKKIGASASSPWFGSLSFYWFQSVGSVLFEKGTAATLRPP